MLLMKLLSKNSRSLGFTLIEVMIAMVIIGVLATVSVPGYRKYRNRAKMAEAYGALSKMTKDQSVYFLTNREFFHQTTTNPLFLATPMVIVDNASWKLLGFPTAVGSSVYFSYLAKAGKVNASGTEITAAGSSVSGNGFTTIADGALLAVNYSGSGSCNASGYSGSTFGAVSTANLNWVVVAAVTDINNDLGATCTTIGRLIKVLAGEQIIEGPFIQISE